MCERESITCPAAGTAFNNGWYNVGTDPNKSVPALSACVAPGCALTYTGGSISKSRLIGGVKTFFAQGEYQYSGFTCTVSAGTGPSSQYNVLPGSTCSAGQSYIYMNGREKCFDSGTGQEVSTASASAVASTGLLADANLAATIDAASQAALAAGGDASAVQAAAVMAAAQTAADSTAAEQEEEQKDPCLESDKVGCLDTGDIPEAEEIGTKELNFSTFAFNTYTFSGTASCPAPRAVTISGTPMAFSYQPFCDFLNVFKFAALAVSMFVAAMIMIGQRSSDSGG